MSLRGAWHAPPGPGGLGRAGGVELGNLKRGMKDIERQAPP